MTPDGTAMTGLSPNTKYYVALYGKFSSGEYYSDVKSFTTLDIPFVMYNGNKLYYYTGNIGTEGIWGPDGVTGANSAINGSSNTTIINNLPGFYIAKVCELFNAWGYDDWYMPSLDEITTVYISGGIPQSNLTSYWTSTEFDNTKAYKISASNGTTSPVLKSLNYKCFCVRKN